MWNDNEHLKDALFLMKKGMDVECSNVPETFQFAQLF